LKLDTEITEGNENLTKTEAEIKKRTAASFMMTFQSKETFKNE
jgi:hypothetical protein